MSTTPAISSKLSPARPDVDLSRDLQKGADVPHFDQVMNLVQPKIAQEAVKAYESNAHDHVRKGSDELSRIEHSKSKSIAKDHDSDSKVNQEANEVSGHEVHAERAQRSRLHYN